MYYIELELCLSRGTSFPNYTVNIDNYTIISKSTDSMIVKHSGKVLDNLIIDYRSKSSDETILEDSKIIRDQTIEILNIWIDGIKITPFTLSKISNFIPKYREDFLEYCQKENIPVDFGPLHTNKFWHAGSWTLQMGLNFWFNYNKVIFDDTSSDYVGLSSECVQENLTKLKNLL